MSFLSVMQVTMLPKCLGTCMYPTKEEIESGEGTSASEAVCPSSDAPCLSHWQELTGKPHGTLREARNSRLLRQPLSSSNCHLWKWKQVSVVDNQPSLAQAVNSMKLGTVPCLLFVFSAYQCTEQKTFSMNVCEMKWYLLLWLPNNTDTGRWLRSKIRFIMSCYLFKPRNRISQVPWLVSFHLPLCSEHLWINPGRLVGGFWFSTGQNIGFPISWKSPPKIFPKDYRSLE